MPDADPSPSRPRRARSHRYPGATLAEAIELCRRVEERGVDGLAAADLAAALGYSNIKTNTFSARLSSARQFGLIERLEGGYRLTPAARAILHPVEPADLPRLHRQSFLEAPLYAGLVGKLAGKAAPSAAVLANQLYHQYRITAAAKLTAAELFLDSARFAGILDEKGVIRPDGPLAAESDEDNRRTMTPVEPEVRIDLLLWGPDRGKTIRVRAPEAISTSSFDRLIQALRLHLRIEDRPGPDRPGPLDDPRSLA